MSAALLLIFSFITVGEASGNTFAATKSELPPLLKQIEAKYEKAKTLSAEFSQANEVAATKQTKISSGMFIVKMPDKLRWETLKPDTNLLVSDGKTFWFYTPPFDETEHGQLIERKSSQAQSRLAQALLSGKFSVLKNMPIKTENKERFSLSPKKGTAADITHIEIQIDSKELLITKVKLDHAEGNKTEISLSKVVLGQPLDDRLFTFIAPPGTELIRQ